MKEPASTLDKQESRRGLLALIGVGGAAALAALLGRRSQAEANHAATAGGNFTSSSAVPAVHAENTDGGPAVVGDSDSGYGVVATSATSIGISGSGPEAGVQGISETKDGVRGRRPSTTGAGAGVQGFSGVVESDAPKRIGVRGVGADEGVRGQGKTGVRGDGDGTAASIGVHARNSGGRTALKVDGGPLALPKMTTAERKAIPSPVNGMLIYNTTVNRVQVRTPAGWVSL
ncbi:MAG: hypothetical protein HYS09_09840 [Chloroflexi bacterium]|nr:hypothetical protein [Chloroflexota bacterium]